MKKPLNGTWLKCIAMASMVCDHAMKLWGIDSELMLAFGRVAFPVFAFLIAEGYAHTSNLNRYMGRLLLWAVLTEVPFDMVFYGKPLMWGHQNVLWTFLLGLLVIRFYERYRDDGDWFGRTVSVLGSVVMAGVFGIFSMCDYEAVGVLTVFLFHVTRDYRLSGKVIQAVCLFLLSMSMVPATMLFEIAGTRIPAPEQVFCLLALPFIWLYNGRPGYRAKWFQWACYAFYPVHLIVISVLA